MSRSRSARRAVSRAGVLAAVLCSAMVGLAGTSLAAPTGAVESTGTVSAGPVIAGLSLGALMWAVAGFSLLVLGFIAASRSGRQDAGRAAVLPIGSGRTFQPSAVDAHAEPTSSAVTV